MRLHIFKVLLKLAQSIIVIGMGSNKKMTFEVFSLNDFRLNVFIDN